MHLCLLAMAPGWLPLAIPAPTGSAPSTRLSRLTIGTICHTVTWRSSRCGQTCIVGVWVPSILRHSQRLDETHVAAYLDAVAHRSGALYKRHGYRDLGQPFDIPTADHHRGRCGASP